MRTLESIYWHGVRVLRSSAPSSLLKDGGDCFVDQWEPYEALDMSACLPPTSEALRAAADVADTAGLPGVSGTTKLLIVPGYPFQTYATLVPPAALRSTAVFQRIAGAAACLLTAPSDAVHSFSPQNRRVGDELSPAGQHVADVSSRFCGRARAALSRLRRCAFARLSVPQLRGQLALFPIAVKQLLTR